MFDFFNSLIEYIESFFEINRETAVSILVTFLLAILSGILMSVRGIWAFIQWIKERRIASGKIANFRRVARRKLNPTDIMQDRGKVINGFDAKVYFSRDEVDGEINSFLGESAQTSNLLVVTGLLSSGKSRAVYEALKKSNVKKIALFPSISNKERGSIKWTEKQWIEAICNLKDGDILYIDSISDVKFEEAGDSVDELKKKWINIFQNIHSRNLRCIVTLATMPHEKEGSFATEFLKSCNSPDDEFRGQNNASSAIRMVQIPEISKGDDDFYKKCKTFLSGDYYSPVVGDYINNDRYYGSIWKEFNKLATEHDGQCVRLFVAIMLTQKYNRNSIPCYYLQKVYGGLAADANIPAKIIENDFSEAYEQLEHLKLVRMSESKAVCDIYGERSFEYIKSKLFDSLDTYHDRKLKDDYYEPKSIEKWVEPYIRRNDNLYIERKQAKLIISLSPDNLSFYKDAVVYAAPQNLSAITEEVRRFFNSHFFVLDQEEKPIRLKPEFKSQMDDICDLVGVLVSRSCNTYIKAKTYLDEYLNAGVQIHEDIICELLRIAAEEDIPMHERERLKEYAFMLADKKYGNGKTKGNGIQKLLSQSPRFNTSYESVSEDYDAARIAKGFALHADALKQTYDLVIDYFNQNNEDQLEPNSGKTYLKLWQKATNSLFRYCRTITEHIRSIEDLKLLLAILSIDDIRKRSAEIEKELQGIEQNKNYKFVFINASESAMSNVVNSILTYNPLGYVGECKDMIVFLLQSLNNHQYNYIYNEKSIIFLIGTRESGVMGIIPDYKNTLDFYNKLKDALRHAPRSLYIENALKRCLYPLFDRIKNEKNFQDAQKLLPSLEEINKAYKEDNESIIVNRKLVNSFIGNAPSYELGYKAYKQYGTILNGRIDTINILLGLLKKELQRRHISDADKKKYVKYTIKWIEVIRKLEWNKFSTDAARAKSILTSIKLSVSYRRKQTIRYQEPELTDENVAQEKRTINIRISIKDILKNIKTSIRNIIYYQRLSNKISMLQLPDESTQQESRDAKKINVLKGRKDKSEYSRKVLNKLFKYLNTRSREDIFEDSDYLTHLITFAYNDGQISKMEIDNYRAMFNEDNLNMLICPKMDFYKMALLRVFPRNEYDFAFRWEFVKHAYLRMMACNTLPKQRDKQMDLLFVLIRSVAYQESGDAIQGLSEDVHSFVAEHPIFITMYMATICKLFAFYAGTQRNIEDPEKFRESILPEMNDKIGNIRLGRNKESIPQSEEEKIIAAKIVIQNLMDRINKQVMTLKINNKPLPFNEQFAISIDVQNGKISTARDVKGPSTSDNDTTRHDAWDYYVVGKDNVNYEDLVPKIIKTEVQRICKLMCEGKTRENNFHYLNKELLLLEANCTAERYLKLFNINVNGTYIRFKQDNTFKTAKWPNNFSAQLSIFYHVCKDELEKWNHLQPQNGL